MFDISVFLYIVLFLVYIWLTGKCISEIVGISNKLSSAFYGFVSFFAMYWSISIPFQILGLSWESYFPTITSGIIIYSIVLIGMFFGKIKKNKLSDYFVFDSKNIIISIVFLIVIFLFYYKNLYNIVSVFDSGLIGSGIVRDDFFYSGLSSSLIDNPQMFQNFTAVDYFGVTLTEVPFDRKISITESFMAYFSVVLGIKPIEFAHYYMPFIFYFMVFTSLKECVYQVTKKRFFGYLIGVVVFLLVSPSGDTLKFLVTPWYGNLVNIFIMPSVLLVAFNMITQKNKTLFFKLSIFVVASIYVNCFAAVSAFGYLALMIIFSITLMLKLEKNSKYFFIAITSMILIVIMHTLASLGGGYELQSVKNFIVDARIYIVAFIFFILHINTQNIDKKYFVYFKSLVIIVLLTYVPWLNQYLYTEYSFIYKRFMDLIILQIVIWGSVYISNTIMYEYKFKGSYKQYIKATITILAMSCLFYISYDKGIRKMYVNTLDYSTQDYKYKIHPTVVEVAENILGKQTGKILVNNYATNQTRIPFLEFIPLVNDNLITESLYKYKRENPYDEYTELSTQEYVHKLLNNDFYLTVNQNEVQTLTSNHNVQIMKVIPQQHELTGDLYVLDLRNFEN